MLNVKVCADGVQETATDGFEAVTVICGAVVTPLNSNAPRSGAAPVPV